MSSEKPVSDPLEPEGTGVPADAAAEHSPSGKDETDAAPSSGAAENRADEPASETGAADTTARSGKADASDSASETTKSASAAEPDAARAGTAGDEKTAVIGKAGAAADDAVVVDKAGAAESGATVAASESEAATEKVDIGKKSAAEEEAKSGEGATPTGRRSPFPLPALIGAAALLVAALVAVGVFFFLAGNKQDELDRRASATKAACDFGNNFATYTGDGADDYIQRLDRSATGEWKKLVSQIGPDLKTRFAESEVSSTATGVQCGYESGSGDEARVVLVIDQQFTTANVPQEQGPGQVKVAANVSMQKIDGTWLVADFDTPMMQQ
ncbi:hypothetical protein ACWDT6_19725 [Nocardia grenadensis]